jgi:dimethylargininase
VPASYDRCVRGTDVAIDVERAQLQQGGYVELLRYLGVDVEVLPPDESFPDSCFVEDAAVVLDSRVVITRPGVASRRGEGAFVWKLGEGDARYVLHEMQAPATLDGGDVLRVGARLFVGHTRRTNAAGIDFLADVARRDGLEVVPVDVEAGLHLKSWVTVLDPERVVVWGDAVDLGPLRARGVGCVVVPEPAGANVLALGSKIMISAAAPRTADLIESLGFAVHRDDVGELHKGDGALTCLSLRFAPPGCWCV